MAKKKPSEWKEVKLSPDTPQSMAEIFNRHAETLKKYASGYVFHQDDKNVCALYLNYKELLLRAGKACKGMAKLPDLPDLIGNDYHNEMIHFEKHCRDCAAILTGKTNSTDNAEPVYIEIDLATHIVTVGTKSHLITSDKVWMFIKTLVDDKKQYRATPIKDGEINWKNARDMLVKKIGKIPTGQMLLCAQGCYTLDPNVAIKGTGQIGLYRTKSS